MWLSRRFIVSFAALVDLLEGAIVSGQHGRFGLRRDARPPAWPAQAVKQGQGVEDRSAIRPAAHFFVSVPTIFPLVSRMVLLPSGALVSLPTILPVASRSVSVPP